MTLIPYTPNRVQSLMLKLAATPWGGQVLRRCLRPLDRLVLRLSRDRQSMTGLVTGLPLILLTTTGAKSGLPRTNPLMAGVDGERLVIYPTNFGQEKAPGWLHNMRANPRVTVTYQGIPRPYQAREATPAEEEAYWQQAAAFYPGYLEYRARVRTRFIPVVVLEPVEAVG